MSENNGQTRVDPRFIVERQGRQFVLYAGLLDMAHQEGLTSIETELIQDANEDNGMTWVFKAKVVTDKGTFTGHADANPSNVTRAMLTVTLRLAETRAKARALRDAVNVGMAALEELGEMADSGPEWAPDAASTNDRFPASRPPPSHPDAILASPAQVRAIYGIGRDRLNLSEADIDDQSTQMYGTHPAELTKKQASDFITKMNNEIGAPAHRGS